MLIVFFRAIILYVLIMFCIRLMGKRQLGELQPSELVITILISNIASLPIEDTGIPMTLVGFELILSNISLQSKTFRGFISGHPIVIINNGQIDQKQLRKLRLSIDDLMESLRQNKIFDIRDVEYAIVETTGKISILEKFDSQNATAKMLNIQGESKQPPAIIISDGIIVRSALSSYNITEEWIYKTIRSNYHTLKSVFLMTVDMDKNYFIVPKQK